MEHQIRIGPAGWSYTDWEGTVYPPHRSKFDQLAYLASFFDTIEINSPFYTSRRRHTPRRGCAA